MADERRTVVFSLAGRTYRVITSAPEQEVLRHANALESRMRAANAGKPPGLEAAILVAITLLHELESQRARTDEIARSTRTTMSRLVDRIDSALTNAAEESE